MLWSSSMRDTRNAALIAVKTKRAGHPDRRELLNRIVVSSSHHKYCAYRYEGIPLAEERKSRLKSSFRFYALGGCWIDKIVD